MKNKNTDNSVSDLKINDMQLLNDVYNLFKYLNIEEMREIGTILCRDLGKTATFKKLTNPVVTCWWLIGVTACELLEHWEIYGKTS